MMKKWLCMLLCLVLLALPLCSFADVRMPELRSNINDSADVLSAAMNADLATFSKNVTKKADIDLYMATVHFLDGMEVQLYADELFAKWGLDEKDILLVGAAGEDSFALHMGAAVEEKLGRTNVDNLLYISSEFAQLFRTQQYDAAYASFCISLNLLLEKQTGNSVRIDGLFSNAALTLQEQISAYSEELWSDVRDSIDRSTVIYRDRYDREEREQDGMTAGGWLVLAVLIIVLFRQSKKDRNVKKGCSGCLTALLVAIVLFMALLAAIF